MSRPSDMIHAGHITSHSGWAMMRRRWCLLRCVARMETINVWRRLREVSLGLDEARLKIDDVITELVILGLNGFVVLV
jgi:hypothetical protein